MKLLFTKVFTKGIIVGGAIASFATLSISHPAQALDFSFSFENTDASGVPGTVSGRILGLTDNSTSPASNVIIDSFPDSLDDIDGFNVGNDATTWSSVSNNSFTVSGGNIVEGSTVFTAFDFNPSSDGFCLNSNCFFGPAIGFSNGFSLRSFTYTANQDGFAGATYTPIPFEFESTVGLMVLGGISGGYALLKKRKKQKRIV